jgi:osmotically-inducible protein OsmY
MQQSSERVAKAMEDKAATEADHTLNQRIRQALTGDMALATVIQKIYLDTANGEVTLHGSGVTDKQKADIAAKVQHVAGVKKVENQLQTASN